MKEKNANWSADRGPWLVLRGELATSADFGCVEFEASLAVRIAANTSEFEKAIGGLAKSLDNQ